MVGRASRAFGQTFGSCTSLVAPCCSIMINGFLRSYTCSLSLCVANLHFSSQLTKGRPKPQKVNRKNAGEKLAETRATRTLANSPHVPTPGTPIQSASLVAKPSLTPITPFRVRAAGTTFHADVSTQRCAHQPTSQADRPSVDATNQWNEQALMGIRSSDPVRPNPNLQKKSFLAGIPYPSPDLLLPLCHHRSHRRPDLLRHHRALLDDKAAFPARDLGRWSWMLRRHCKRHK